MMKKSIALLSLMTIALISFGQNEKVVSTPVYTFDGPHKGIVFTPSPTANVELAKEADGSYSFYVLDKTNANAEMSGLAKAEVIIGYQDETLNERFEMTNSNNKFNFRSKRSADLLYFVITYEYANKVVHARFLAKDLK